MTKDRKSSNGGLDSRSRFLPWLAFLPLALYLLGLNPYFIPDVYDNVIFFEGGKAIANSGQFLWQGKYTVDWGPGLSALLAIPFKFGQTSVLASKLVVLGCTAIASILAYRLLVREERTHPALTIAITLLLPLSFLHGTRIMAEWPYCAFSFLFLYLLSSIRQSDQNKMALALLCGLALGYASIIRFIGVLLGAAVLAQAWAKIRGRDRSWKIKEALPELIVALVGSSVFLGWKFWIAIQTKAGMAHEPMYYTDGWIERIMTSVSPLQLFQNVSQLLFQWEGISRTLNVPSIAVQAGATIVVLFVTIGIVNLWRARRFRPMDIYALVVLTLILFMAERAHPRYLLPLAPLMVNYFLVGLKSVIELLSKGILKQKARAIFHVTVALWCLLLLLMQCQLIAKGKPIHGGLSVLASQSEATFYKGIWSDIYQACQWITDSSNHPGNVGTTAGMNRYVHGFTQRLVPDKLTHEMSLAFVIEFDDDPLDRSLHDAMNIVEERKVGGLTVYKLGNKE